MLFRSESEKAGLNLIIQKTKIIAFGPITSWQIDGEKVETVSDFIFLGSKITSEGDCSHKIKTLALWTKNLNSVLKIRDITLPTNVHICQSYGFSSSHVCESWAIKKAEC